MDEFVTRAVGIAFAALRSFIQGMWGGAVAWLASLGITLTAEQSAAVEITLTAAIFAAVVAGIRALETVQGEKLWQRWARRIGAVLMLGTSAIQPAYAKPASSGSTEDRS